MGQFKIPERNIMNKGGRKMSERGINLSSLQGITRNIENHRAIFQIIQLQFDEVGRRKGGKGRNLSSQRIILSTEKNTKLSIYIKHKSPNFNITNLI